jgi:hypothetical protein
MKSALSSRCCSVFRRRNSRELKPEMPAGTSRGRPYRGILFQHCQLFDFKMTSPAITAFQGLLRARQLVAVAAHPHDPCRTVPHLATRRR